MLKLTSPGMRVSACSFGFVPIAGLTQFVAQLKGKGIALAFEKPVDWVPFTGGDKPGPTMLAELQVRTAAANGTFVWATLDFIEAHPITDIKPSPADQTLITDWSLLATATKAEGFALKATTAFKLEAAAGTPLRIVFYTDFVTSDDGKLALDGSHIAGVLPTGRGAAGDTFRTWFTIDG